MDEDDLLNEILEQITPEDLVGQENRAEQGEYGKLAVEFLFAKPPKKIIEINLSDGPFKGRMPQTVAQGFKNAFKRAKIKEDRATVITRTVNSGRVAVWLINVRAARQNRNGG